MLEQPRRMPRVAVKSLIYDLVTLRVLMLISLVCFRF